MAGFDMALGIDQDTLNRAIKAMYPSAHNRIFMGSYSIEIHGIKAAIKWDISKAPMLDLNPSVRAEAVIPEILAKLQTHKNISKSNIKLAVSSMTNATFSMIFPSIVLTLSLPVAQQSATFSANVLCQARINPNGQIELAAVHLDLDTLTNKLEFLDLIINSLSAPLIHVANNVLKGIRIPSVTVEGITLSTPAAAVSGGRLIILVNLASKGSPAPVRGPWPNGAVFSLASKELINEAVRNSYYMGKIPHEISYSGSQDMGITTAYYRATIQVGLPDVGMDGADFVITLRLGGNVDAGFTTFLGRLGLNYKAVIQPNPIACKVVLSVNSSQQLMANIPSMPRATVFLQPQGNVGEEVLSTLNVVQANIVSLILSSLIPQIIRSISVPVATIPSIPVDFGDVHVKIRASNLHVGNFSGMALIAGNLEVTNA
ncbi:MAG: hypothetical protein PHW87_06260 [Methanothrix sp.]|nr:hypothetical protein [Methanothrix sp.]